MTTEKHEPDRRPYVSYQIRGVLYIPHYLNPDAFVGPGFGFCHKDYFSKEQLLEAGAKECVEMLLTRPTFAAKGWND